MSCRLDHLFYAIACWALCVVCMDIGTLHMHSHCLAPARLAISHRIQQQQKSIGQRA